MIVGGFDDLKDVTYILKESSVYFNSKMTESAKKYQKQKAGNLFCPQALQMILVTSFEQTLYWVASTSNGKRKMILISKGYIL